MHFGYSICDDYQLSNYSELVDYWRKLQRESARVRMQSIGKTEEGREQYMLLVTDPRNHRNLEGIRRTNASLARAKDLNEDQAAKLSRTAKTIVWIDGGLHATEVLGAQQLIQTAYELASREDEETRRILRDCVILLVHANPDGMELVSNWYRRRPILSTRSLEGVPVLYQKYAGHDNNRDFYASNLAETRNMNRIFYSEWYPQIVYNHHQSAPAGTIMFIPPFRNPFNYHVDPIAQIGIDTAGIHMHQRLIGKGMGGTVMRNGAPYSGWWNGGLRTTTYFHNMIGILTETWGSPNPTLPPFQRERQIPQGDIPKPLDIRQWHLKDSLAYEIEANFALLDYASRYRERIVFDHYRMGKNSIERGSRDNWTRYPSRIASFGRESLEKPELRDARAYVISAEQRDPSAVSKFVQMLLHAGIEVRQLLSSFDKWPQGSYVIRCDQAFRPHILDMFEAQDYPNDFQYPGGPPIPPYDSAGYTPAFTMGIEFERILDGELLAKMSGEDGSNLKKIGLENVPEWPGDDHPFRKRFIDQGPRIGLWDRYGGSMPSGWTRWLLEKFAAPFEVVFAPELDSGSLRDRFDVLLFVDGAIPGASAASGRAELLTEDRTIPYHLRRRMGSISLTKTLPRLREFVESGGHIIAIGSSALNLAKHWPLGVASALQDNAGNPLPNTQFYIPGSVMRITLNKSELTEGLPEAIDVMFDSSPAFRIASDAPAQVIASFKSDKSLRSGWAWGQEKLEGTAAIVDVPFGRGRVVLIGPEVNFRGQTLAAVPILFNALLRSKS